MVKITYKGETRDIPKRYIPDTLSSTDRKKQIKSIFEGTDRPKVNYKERQSSYTVKFNKKYGGKFKNMSGGKSVENIAKVVGLPFKPLKEIFERGEKAYESGSRPGVSRTQWGYGRLYGYLMNNPKVRKADEDITKKYKINFKNML
tara:strand:+ start:1838 stop:2275 length:438 start_codon:yes stop_codon:yes gene_type:complete